MRPVLHGDATAAARALLAVPPTERCEVLHRMFAEADRAEAFRSRTGRAHPTLGAGSLMAVAMTRPRAPEPVLNDPDYAACLALLFTALAERR